MINGIKEGKPLNEGVAVAESTLTAIMCRECSYTGKQIKWDDLLKSGPAVIPGQLRVGATACAAGCRSGPHHD